MKVTQEQRVYARFAGVLLLAKIVVELLGDFPTIIARGGETFAQTATYILANTTFWRFSLLCVGIAWILTGIVGFALYVVLEPVNRRLAQLSLILRLGAPFVGGASLMFRVANARVHTATANGQFTTEQFGTLDAVTQTGANAGVYTAWILMGLGSLLAFVLFLRSRYLPRWLSIWGAFAAVLLIVLTAASFVFPRYAGTFKPILIVSLLADITFALWLVIKGLRPSNSSWEGLSSMG
jgi:hypothetical protein